MRTQFTVKTRPSLDRYTTIPSKTSFFNPAPNSKYRTIVRVVRFFWRDKLLFGALTARQFQGIEEGFKMRHVVSVTHSFEPAEQVDQPTFQTSFSAPTGPPICEDNSIVRLTFLNTKRNQTVLGVFGRFSRLQESSAFISPIHPIFSVNTLLSNQTRKKSP